MKFLFIGIGSILVFIGFITILGYLAGFGMSEVSAGFGILIIVAGLVVFVKGAKRNELLICGYCGFETNDDDKLQRHTLTCEKYLIGNNISEKSNLNALDILKERYAKGEITKEEFNKMNEELLDVSKKTIFNDTLKTEKSKKKRLSKKKKIVIVVGVLILIYFITLGFRSGDNEIESNSEPIIFSGTYDDLLRYENDHVNKIVTFSGYVMQVQKTYDGYDISIWNTHTLQDNTQYYLIHNYPKRLLNDDRVSGYGTYYGICTESRAGSPYACFKDVKLESIDFRTQTDGVCDDLIAKQFGLC